MRVNDIHSCLNPTDVAEVRSVSTAEEVQEAMRSAARSGQPLSIAGGRHAMGGQQFVTGGTVLDTLGLSKVLELDEKRGLVHVQAGIQWPQLIDELHRLQRGSSTVWSIAQKQTGADRLTVGGALAANAHGRGLTMPPLVADAEDFMLVTSDGELRRCSRTENAELFSLAIGGYGLFGVMASVTLRLAPRQKIQRAVEVIELPDLAKGFEERVGAGFTYGDFQFSIDNAGPDFLRRGIFSCYRPIDPETPVPEDQLALTGEKWRQLLHLAHFDKARGFERYAEHYLATSGQIYWSDTHQLSTYLDDYHKELDARTAAVCPGSEMITEIYVPRSRLTDFMGAIAEDFRRDCVSCIYGTVRLIERDEESFLAWARDRWACVIFNLHVDHSEDGMRCAADSFRGLIDRGIERGGSYFLTYHRYARKEQVLACYPQFPAFLEKKRAFDPGEVLQSDWYRHHREMFA